MMICQEFWYHHNWTRSESDTILKYLTLDSRDLSLKSPQTKPGTKTDDGVYSSPLLHVVHHICSYII